jgi:hypothetical protein
MGYGGTILIPWSPHREPFNLRTGILCGVFQGFQIPTGLHCVTLGLCSDYELAMNYVWILLKQLALNSFSGKLN